MKTFIHSKKNDILNCCQMSWAEDGVRPSVMPLISMFFHGNIEAFCHSPSICSAHTVEISTQEKSVVS